MKSKTGLKTNIVFSIVTQLICYIAPLIVSPYLSRVLGPEGIGEYSYGFSYVYYFSAFVSFGFSSYGIKAISSFRNDKNQYSKLFWTIIIERFLFFLISTSVYLILVLTNCISNSIDISILLAFVLVLIANVLDIAFLFQGLENFKIISILNMIINLAYIASIFLFVRTSNDVFFYTIIKSSVGIVINVILWGFAIKKIARVSFSRADSITIIKKSALYFFPSVLMSAGSQLDQTFIGLFCNNSEVGYYQAASKFPTLVSSFIYGIAPVLLSRVSFLFKENSQEEIKKSITKATTLALFLSIPCCTGLYFIGSILIPLFFGSSFTPAITILYYLIPIALLSPISSIFIYSYFYPSGKEKIVSLFLLFSLFLNITVTVLTLKFSNLGACGAALGTLVAESFLLLILYLYSRKTVLIQKLLSDLWKILLSDLIMSCLLLLANFFIKTSNLALVFIDVGIGAVSFLGSCLLLKESISMMAIKFCKEKFALLINHTKK